MGRLLLALVVMPLLAAVLVASDVEATPSPVDLGKALHLEILGRYKDLHPGNQEPLLYGAIKNPIAIILVPIDDWAALKPPERELLEAYAASCVEPVKQDPFRYAGLSPNAPLSGRIRQEVSRMTASSWGIMGGTVYNDGREIRFDKIVAQGTP